MSIASHISGVACHAIQKRGVTLKEAVSSYGAGPENSPPPALYYTFETGTGTTVVDRSASATSNPAEFGAGGTALSWITGGTGSFGVGAASGDYAAITHSADLNWDHNSPWTISVYVNTTSAVYCGVYVKRENLAGGYRGPAVFLFNGRVQLYLVSVWDTADICLNGTTQLNDGQWHHLAVTYSGNGLADGFTVYEDDSVESLSVLGTHDNLAGETTQNSLDANICNATDSLVHFLGGMDELAIWNVELTASQVSALYNGGNAIDCGRGL